MYAYPLFPDRRPLSGAWKAFLDTDLFTADLTGEEWLRPVLEELAAV
jgi:hypothetical protein